VVNRSGEMLPTAARGADDQDVPLTRCSQGYLRTSAARGEAVAHQVIESITMGNQLPMSIERHVPIGRQWLNVTC
jgi:hypothetical protein